MGHRQPHDIALAAAAAAVFSGAPSTAWTLATGGDVFQSTRAAATVLPTHRDNPGLAAGIAVHVVLSAGWTAVLAVVVPRRGAKTGAIVGAVAGLAIAALDMGIIARRWFPAMAALPTAPQYADHVAFGAIAGALLGRQRRR